MVTVEEWSNAFDVQVADYIHKNEFGVQSPIAFDEYEKSLFLTKALEQIVLEAYNGNFPPDSFERTEKVRRELASLVTTLKCLESESQQGVLLDVYKHTLYDLPLDCWYIIYEYVVVSSEDPCYSNRVLSVYPVTHDDYQRIIGNPFRGPNNRKVLRLDSADLQIEIVSSFTISSYTIKYLSKPSPIVLQNFGSEGLSIEGITTALTCRLSDAVHLDILDRAVSLALATRIPQQNKSN